MAIIWFIWWWEHGQSTKMCKNQNIIGTPHWLQFPLLLDIWWLNKSKQTLKVDHFFAVLDREKNMVMGFIHVYRQYYNDNKINHIWF